MAIHSGDADGCDRMRRFALLCAGGGSMNSSAWSNALLVAVLLALLAAVVLASAAAAPNSDRRWTTIGCALAAMGAAVLLVTGTKTRTSGLAPDDFTGGHGRDRAARTEPAADVVSPS